MDWFASIDQIGAAWLAALARASWQGGLALAAVFLLDRLLPRLSPGLRCWLWRLAYVKLLLALFWTTPVDLPLLPAGRSVGVWGYGSEGVGRAGRLPPGSMGVENRTVTPATPRPLSPSAAFPLPDSPTPPLPYSPTSPPPHSALLLGAWLLGPLAATLLLLRAARRTGRLRRQWRPVTDSGLLQEAEELCRRGGLLGVPRLMVTENTRRPLVAGLLRPVIALPRRVLETARPLERRLILAHELAHLQRDDLRWNWLPWVAQALFFFHPLVWLAARPWRVAQEMAADEWAVRVAGAPVHVYGELLLKLAARPASRGEERLLAVGVLASYRTLERRLSAMKHFQPRSNSRTVVATLALAGIALLGGVPWRVVAQEAGRAAAPESSAPAPGATTAAVAAPAAPAGARPNPAPPASPAEEDSVSSAPPVGHAPLRVPAPPAVVSPQAAPPAPAPPPPATPRSPEYEAARQRTERRRAETVVTQAEASRDAARSRLEFARAQTEAAQQRLDAVLKRIRAGEVAAVDRFLPESALFNAQVARKQAEMALEMAEEVLRHANQAVEKERPGAVNRPAAPATPAAPAARNESPAARALADARLAAARKTFEALMERYRLGAPVSRDEIYLWSRRLLDAQRAVGRTAVERRTAAAGHLDRMKEMEEAAKARVRAGDLAAAELPAAEYYRLEAELWLAEEEGRASASSNPYARAPAEATTSAPPTPAANPYSRGPAGGNGGDFVVPANPSSRAPARKPAPAPAPR